MLSLYLGLSLSLLVLDHRFHYLEWVRQGVSMVTAPLHMVAHDNRRRYARRGSWGKTGYLRSVPGR